MEIFEGSSSQNDSLFYWNVVEPCDDTNDTTPYEWKFKCVTGRHILEVVETEFGVVGSFK